MARTDAQRDATCGWTFVVDRDFEGLFFQWRIRLNCFLDHSAIRAPNFIAIYQTMVSIDTEVL